MRVKTIALFTIAVSLLGVCCKNPMSRQVAEVGSLNVSVPGAKHAGAKSILPSDMSITTYRATGSGPGGAAIPSTDSTSGSFSFGNLAVGSWTITVNGLDASSNVIASGQATTAIGAGTTASATVQLTPTAGTGTLSLTASWPSGKTIDEVSGMLTPDGGTTSPISLTISGATASYTNGSLAAGSYVLVINFKKAGVIVAAPRMETVLVYNVKTSSGTFALTEADFNAYFVSYNPNGATGGTPPTDTNAYQPGARVTVIGNIGGLVRDNYIFAGWSASLGGTVLGSIFSIGTGNTTLFAVWIQLAQWANSLASGSEYHSDSAFSAVTTDSLGNSYAVGCISSGYKCEFGNGVSATAPGILTSSIVLVKYSTSGLPQWAQTVTTGTNSSQFSAVTNDSSGNIYAAGYMVGTGTYDFGNGVSIAGPSGNNPVIVKYNSSGTAQWARTLSSGSGDAQFTGAAVNTSGEIYVVGYIYGGVACGFGNGVFATGANSGVNTLIVKYNNAGIALWAQTVTVGTDRSQFNGVTIDSSGNAYAVGNFNSSGPFIFGNGISVTGGYGGGNAIIVKYNPAGIAQWAQSSTPGSSLTYYLGVTIDGVGNSYAVGSILGGSVCGFGPGISATGVSLNNNTIVIVKYNSSGVAQWAQTESSGAMSSQLTAATSDSSGNIYAVGNTSGSGVCGFGNNVSVSGTNVDFIVKYNLSGIAQWAQTGPGSMSVFSGVAIDSVGATFAVGSIYGAITSVIGNGVSVTTSGDDNHLLVKYGPY